MKPINRKPLLGWGMSPGPHFKPAMEAANAAAARGECGKTDALAFAPPPTIPFRKIGPGYFENIRPADEGDAYNLWSVRRDLAALMRVPTVPSGAIMPDACPAGTIPVGAVVATKGAIHSGFHSADICCTLAVSVIGDVDPKAALDAGMASTFFGYGGRPDPVALPLEFAKAFKGNSFLTGMSPLAAKHFASQGDGDHFL